MAVGKIILSITLASFIMCEPVPQISRHKLDLEQLIGAWNDLGILYADYDSTQHQTCNWLNITKVDDGKQNFIEVYKYMLNGYPVNMKAQGTIVNNEIHTWFPDSKYKTVYTAVKYRNGIEMIIHGAEGKYYGVVSRESELSAETKAEFEKLAQQQQLNPVYYSHNNCKNSN